MKVIKKKKKIDISSSLQNRFEIQRFKNKIKKRIQDASDELYIALFVLSVAELEYRLKECLNIYNDYQNKGYYDNLTLGKAIQEFKCIIYELLIRNVSKGDYRVNFLLSNKCYENFIERCRDINDLRNNLYHNLFKPKVKGEGLGKIIKEIKKRTDITNNWKQYYSHHPFDFYNSDTLIDKDNKSWSFDLIIEFSRKYYALFFYMRTRNKKYLKFL